MEGWTEQRIGDLFNIKAGGDLQESFYSPCITAYAKWAIYANSLENKGLYGYTSKPRFKGDAVTITGRGDIGHAEYRSEDFDAIVRLLVLLPKVDVNCRYVTYYINSLVHFPEESTGVPQLTAPKVKRIKINIPNSTTEQTAIANILSKVDEAIAAVQTSIDAAERLKKSLMQNLLTGKMKPDGTFRTPEEFYIDEKFGKVPVGWEVKKLKEVCTNTGEYGANASAIPFNGLTPRYIRITDIDDFGNLIDEDKATIDAENYDKYLLQDDDFLFARTGDTVGKSLLYKRAQMGMAVYAGYLIKYTFDKEKIIPEYFNVIAQSEFFERFKVAMKRIGAKPNINSREYSSFKFLLPKTTQEQLAILSRFNDVDTIISKNNSKLIVLGKLKKSLMQNLLTGKVRINNN